VFDVESFDKDVEDVIADLLTGPMVGYARTKHAVNAATLGSLDPAFVLEREGQLGLLAAADFAEGAAAFNEKRPPKFSDTV
jgi:enoyl-CoA hydratase